MEPVNGSVSANEADAIELPASAVTVETVVVPAATAAPVAAAAPAAAEVPAATAVAAPVAAAPAPAPAAPAAPAAPSASDLVLNVSDSATGANLARIVLSPEDQALVKERAAAIVLSDANMIIDYGSSSQKGVADFSDNALQNVRTKNLGEAGDMITKLVTDLKGFSLDEPEKKGLFGLFHKAGNKVEMMKSRYAGIERNIDVVEDKLREHQNQLTRDIVLLDKMYQANLDYYKDLTIYIMAGKERLELERSTTLADLQAKAAASGLPEDAQAASDYANLLDRLEKKIYDLELTRTISIQMAPQIRLIQSSDVLMVEKIQSAIVNTIPLWKNQMVLALGMEHVKQATEAQREVADLTNELLKKNAETLKQGTIAVAEESERSIVEIETLEETNTKLIETFDEVLRIQEEGRVKRAEAEGRLGQLEGQLKDKLLDLAKS